MLDSVELARVSEESPAAEDSGGVSLGLGSSECLGFSLAVTFPQNFKVALLRTPGTDHFRDLKFPVRRPILNEISWNSADQEVNRIQRARPKLRHKSRSYHDYRGYTFSRVRFFVDDFPELDRR